MKNILLQIKKDLPSEHGDVRMMRVNETPNQELHIMSL
jgi:hypothetical protein